MGLNIRRRGVGLVVAAALLFTLTACEGSESGTTNNLRSVTAEECKDIDAKIAVAATEVTEAETALAEKESGENKATLREAEERLEELRKLKESCDQTIETTPTTTSPSGPSTTDASAPSTTEPEVDDATGLSPEVLAMLSVNTFKRGECLKLTDSISTGVVPFKIGALELPVPEGPRLWNDALDVPLPDAEPSVQLEAFKAGICANPHLGFVWGHELMQIKVGEVTLLDLNTEWGSIYDIPVEEIDVKAAEYIPLLDEVNPSPELQALAVKKNKEWAQEADRLIALIDRFSLLWVSEMTSTRNYHLVGGGLVVDGLPEVGLNANQESLPALILMVTEKGACAPIILIGINVGDRRPEEFAPPACAPTPPPEHPGTTTTVPPPCTNCTTTTTQPPCDNCTTTTTTTTIPPPPSTGKPGEPTTVPPPPVTVAPSTTAAPTGPTTSIGNSGPGAPPPATTVAPTPTVAPPATVPATTQAPPTTRVEGP